MKSLAIIGASGHGKVVADIARLIGYDNITFYDDNPSIEMCLGYPVVGVVAKAIDATDKDLFVAVGNAAIRKQLMESLQDRHFPVLVHPSASIAKTAVIGSGTVIAAGAVVNPDTKIGCGCIINTCASVDHDCVIGNYAHISVGARLCGTVTVGSTTWIGAGATVINNLSICNNCTIGAGALVNKSITEYGTYVGVPARKLVR